MKNYSWLQVIVLFFLIGGCRKVELVPGNVNANKEELMLAKAGSSTTAESAA
jgi:hypothetical protein